MHDPQGAHGFDDQVVELIRVCTATGPGNGFQAIDGMAGSILFDEGIVTRILYTRSNLIQGVIPGDVLPLRASWTAHLWLQQTPVVQDVLLKGSSFGTQGAAVNRMVGIPLDVHDLWRHVLGAVPDGVNDDSAAHRAVRAGRTRFTSARNL